MAKLVYPELSYLLMGLFYKIHNELGPSYQEKHYLKATGIKLGILVNFGRQNELQYKRIINL